MLTESGCVIVLFVEDAWKLNNLRSVRDLLRLLTFGPFLGHYQNRTVDHELIAFIS